MASYLEMRMPALAVAWLAVFALACVPRVLFPATAVSSPMDVFLLIAPYALIALAPLAGFVVAAGSFPRGILTAQPSIRLSVYGRWRRLGVIEAQSNPAFGPTGFIASLLVGMLLNVVVRSFEFLVAMPAMGGEAPTWGNRLFMMMAGDVIVMNFFYMVCFVMALRTVPLFPRMLLFAWGLDILLQLFIGSTIVATPGIPAEVARPLHALLEGNIQKVLISAFVWLPYLILSDRVNVTYRRRVRVSAKNPEA
ncbi:DUF2569 domain-containing protein [Tsuneonella sp. SYSU-LHT278]|uniref:DUF2569 domain-containing protein n=1 Tax=Tsuneonella sediminis TaxID=3416089 RepID=UPI003F79CA99